MENKTLSTTFPQPPLQKPEGQILSVWMADSRNALGHLPLPTQNPNTHTDPG